MRYEEIIKWSTVGMLLFALVEKLSLNFIFSGSLRRCNPARTICHTSSARFVPTIYIIWVIG